MASPGGIITVQLGSFANFVGAHYWNLQDEVLGCLGGEHAAAAEEVCAGKLFASGAQLRPRLVALDHKGCQGGVRLQPEDPSYTAQMTGAAAGLWAGPVRVIEAEHVPKSRFYTLLEAETEGDEDDMDVDGAAEGEEADEVPNELEEAAAELDRGAGPRFFTDFLKVVLHPRSVVDVPDFWRQDDAVTAFGAFATEPDYPQVLEAAMDRITSHAEACDSLEGFQLFTDDASSWGGLTASLLSLVRDEFPRQPLYLFSTRAPPPSHDDSDVVATYARCREVNSALAAAESLQSCSLYVPLHTPATPEALPRLIYDLTNRYHTAALQAVAIDCVTLPFRVRPLGSSALAHAAPPSQGATSMADLATLLALPAANVAAVGVSFPAAESPDVAPDAGAADERLSARERRLKGDAPPAPPPANVVSHGLSWFCESASSSGVLAESVSARGLRGAGGALPCVRSMDRLKSALDAEGVRAVRHLAALAMPLAVPLPFPRLLAAASPPQGEEPPRKQPHLTSSSGDAARGRSETAPLPRTCAAVSRFASTSAFESVLTRQAQALQQAWRGADGKQWMRRSGYEQQDSLELREVLLGAARKYQQYDGADGMFNDDEDDDLDDL